eukprot:scaffold34852_cov39-Tisochrysis_lutea.AAC.2
MWIEHNTQFLTRGPIAWLGPKIPRGRTVWCKELAGHAAAAPCRLTRHFSPPVFQFTSSSSAPSFLFSPVVGRSFAFAPPRSLARSLSSSFRFSDLFLVTTRPSLSRERGKQHNQPAVCVVWCACHST